MVAGVGLVWRRTQRLGVRFRWKFNGRQRDIGRVWAQEVEVTIYVGEDVGSRADSTPWQTKAGMTRRSGTLQLGRRVFRSPRFVRADRREGEILGQGARQALLSVGHGETRRARWLLCARCGRSPAERGRCRCFVYSSGLPELCKNHLALNTLQQGVAAPMGSPRSKNHNAYEEVSTRIYEASTRDCANRSARKLNSACRIAYLDNSGDVVSRNFVIVTLVVTRREDKKETDKERWF